MHTVKIFQNVTHGITQQVIYGNQNAVSDFEVMKRNKQLAGKLHTDVKIKKMVTNHIMNINILKNSKYIWFLFS